MVKETTPFSKPHEYGVYRHESRIIIVDKCLFSYELEDDVRRCEERVQNKKNKRKTVDEFFEWKHEGSRRLERNSKSERGRDRKRDDIPIKPL